MKIGPQQRSRVLAVAMLLAALVGCAHAPTPRTPRATDADPPPVSLPDQDRVIELGAGQAGPAAPKTERITGSGKFLNAELAGQAPPPPPPEGEVTFNFENTPVAAVVEAILGELLKENYVIAPGVGGTVSFATARPVRPQQALSILEMLLSWNNAALVYADGRYSVVPVATAVQGNLVPRMGPPESARGYEVRAVPLRFVAPTEMEKLLTPYAKPGAILRADNARSLIVIAGTRRELQNYLQTIETFDVDWLAGMSFGLYTLERVEVADVIKELEAVFGDAQTSPLAGMLRFVPMERLNAVMVITPQPSYLAQAEQWIKRLDRGGGDAGVRLYVYDVQNVKAIDLADRLNEIFTGQSSGRPRERRTGAGRVAPGLQGTELSSNPAAAVAARNQPVPPVPPPNAPASNGTPAGGGLGLIEGQDIRITAVEENNSLLIRATPAQYEFIREAIKRLDVEPLQVHIEAKILEVTLSNNLNFGVQWYLDNLLGLAPTPTGAAQDSGGGSGAPNPGGGSGAVSPWRNNPTNWAALGGYVRGSDGLTYIFDAPGVRALVNALQSEGDVKVLSSPSLVVLNNKQAAINVGQQIPVVSTFFNTGIGGGVGGVPTQGFVQFRDTGITLDVVPRVNPGGMVYLEISQEQSTPGPASAAQDFGGNVPVNKKTIQTEIAVQSGKTVMLGGLIQQSDSKSNSGLPGLKNIPILGRFLGASRNESSRTELLVLITPTVVEGGSDRMEALTDEYKRRFKGLEALIREEQRQREAQPLPELLRNR